MHAHEKLLRDAYAAMGMGDGRTLARLLSPDTVWVIPGSGKLSGRYRGPDEIFGFWKDVARETGSGLQIEVIDVLANDERAVVLVAVQGRRGERRLDDRQVAVYEFAPDGTVAEATFIYENPAAYDAFWAD